MTPDLSQLRDIHLPAPISWWPPAPGWWLLGALLMASLIGGYAWHRYRRHSLWRRSALAELARLRQQYQAPAYSTQRIVSELSVLLRRVAISCYPRVEVAMLSGDKWLAFLDRSMGEGAAFQSEQGRLLTVVPYVANATLPDETLLALFALCEKWIARLPARGGK